MVKLIHTAKETIGQTVIICHRAHRASWRSPASASTRQRRVHLRHLRRPFFEDLPIVVVGGGAGRWRKAGT